MTTSVDSFFSAGHVHGGFYRATLALWPVLKGILRDAQTGSLCDSAIQYSSSAVDCIAGSLQPLVGEQARGCQGTQPESGAEDACGELEALYICGHSLGGAMAVIAAALLYADLSLANLQAKLRGVYTFGQPMVGYVDFAKTAGKDFGDRLFRHVQGKDLAPRIPPLTTGPFAHFGAEYTSSETGWIPQTAAVEAVGSILPSLAVGFIAWLQYQLPGVPIVRSIRTHWSIRDHGPMYYLRTSLATGVGSVFL